MFYQTTVEEFTNDFIREYGERHLRKISRKINDSRNVRKILNNLSFLNVGPGSLDIVETVMSIPYFMIRGKEIVAMGSVLMLQKWHNESNSDNILLEDSEMLALFHRIMNQCSQI